MEWLHCNSYRKWMEVAYCLRPTLFLLCSLSQKTIVKILSKLLPKIKNLVHPRLLSELSKINLLLEANRCSILWWLMSTQAKIPFPSFLSRNESQDLCSKQGVPSQAVGAACTRRRPCYCWLSPSKQTTTQSDRQLTLSIYGYRRIEHTFFYGLENCFYHFREMKSDIRACFH